MITTRTPTHTPARLAVARRILEMRLDEALAGDGLQRIAAGEMLNFIDVQDVQYLEKLGVIWENMAVNAPTPRNLAVNDFRALIGPYLEARAGKTVGIDTSPFYPSFRLIVGVIK